MDGGFAVEDLTSSAIRVVALLVAALFAVAIAHKARVIARGDARAQPLVQLSDLRRSHAVLVLALAATLETAIVFALILAPLAGLAAALLLLGCYSVELRKLAPGATCDCFGNFMRDTGAAAVRRNIALCTACALALVLALTGVADPASLSQATIGAALVIVAGILAADVLRVTIQPAGAAPDRPRRGGGIAS